MEYTYEEVFEAYIKLKTYIYYDSTNLFMRKQLAIFETGLSDSNDLIATLTEYKRFSEEYDVDVEEDDGLCYYEKKLKVLTAALNQYKDKPKFFSCFLSRIKARFLPKKFKNENLKSKIITNKRIHDHYNIERSAVFIDAPIEIHLISVLWILKEGTTLDSSLFEGCLGNRLILNKEKTAVVQGSGLFKPYPKQYQKWRDDAVESARKNMKDGKDILILNLDIRDFFYSARLRPDKIRSPYKNKANQSLSNLYAIFEEIHKIFTRRVSENKIPYDFAGEVLDESKFTYYILPIGLLSSFVLANDYLKDFDDRIIKHARPVYYGRYVDDILMVITNPVLPDNVNDDSIHELNFNFQQYRDWVNNEKPRYDLKKRVLFGNDEHLSADEFYDNLTDIERFVLLNFHPIISLIDVPSILGINQSSEQQERVFKLNSYPRLYCQSDKTLLYYFDKDESSLVIDKLKRDLEEKSSEFRNYNDEEDLEDFEESAYHLLYDGTEGKIRTLKDYKEDKFGLSIYLSKKIFSSIRQADKVSNEEADKIVTFFQGENALNLYTLWERIFVFLLVNEKPKAYVDFYINCCRAIDGIATQKERTKLSPDVYRESMSEYLENANELALSLYPKFLSEIRDVKRTYQFSFNTFKGKFNFFQTKYSPTDEDSYFIRRYRQSNLLRHHYTAQPLLSYTTREVKDYQNFADLKIPF